MIVVLLFPWIEVSSAVSTMELLAFSTPGCTGGATTSLSYSDNTVDVRNCNTVYQQTQSTYVTITCDYADPMQTKLDIKLYSFTAPGAPCSTLTDTFTLDNDQGNGKGP